MKKIIGKILASLYRTGYELWKASYLGHPDRIKRVLVRVISIGNITWGGTGKTPFTIKLAQWLSEDGKKVAVLTRGYGKDEVQELQKKLPGIPVIVGRDRVRSAREAIEKYGAQIVILDDGFQHLRLHRDLDIVTINSTEPFGPGGLIPLGTLREPIEELKRADAFVLTKCNIGSKNVHWIRQKLNEIKPQALIFESAHQPIGLNDPLKGRRMEVTSLRGRKIGAISGIGDPHSFEKTLELEGSEIVLAARYEDHHQFKASEVLYFVRQCSAAGLRDAVTTEKDYFRIRPILDAHPNDKDLAAFTFWILEIEFQVSDEEDLIRRCLNP